MVRLHKHNSKKRAMSIVLVCILSACVVAVGITKFYKKSDKTSTKENKVQAIDKNAKPVEKKQPIVNDTDIVKGMNVTVAGEKYADSGQEIQEVLRHGKMNIDGKKIAYLTFDDGPSTTVTPQILNILKEKDVKATFFIVGQSLKESEKSKQLLKEEIQQGNAIANHSYTHDYKHLYPHRRVNVDAFMEEINKTNNEMKSILGQDFDTRIIRFPGGHMSWKGTKEIDPILKDGSYSFVDWNALTGDAEGHKKNPEQLLEYLKKDVNEKAKPDRLIVLMHDTYGKENTAKALPSVIDYLKSLGYEFRTIKN